MAFDVEGRIVAYGPTPWSGYQFAGEPDEALTWIERWMEGGHAEGAPWS